MKYSVYCGITHLAIKEGDDYVLFLLRKNPFKQSWLNSTSYYVPMYLPIKGK